MPLPAKVKSLDDVPEGVRDQYAEREGEYVLQVQSVDGWALEPVTGLKSALESERNSNRTRDSKVRELEEKLQLFEGIDPAKAREAQKKLEQLQKDDAKSGVGDEEWQQRLSQIEAKHKQELEKIQQENARMKREADDAYKDRLLDQAIEKFVKETGRRPPSKRVMRTLIDDDTRVDSRDGRRTLAILDGEGKVRVSKETGNHGDMQLHELLVEYSERDELQDYFPGTGASGSGADGRSTAGGGAGVLGSGRISASDQDALNASIEDIASGRVTVTD